MFEKIETHELCIYGCGAVAQYKSPRGKLCCRSTAPICPENKRKMLETMSIVGEDGLNGYQRRALTLKKTMSIIGEDGQTGWERKMRKIANNPERTRKISESMKKIMTSEEASRRSVSGSLKRSLDVIDGVDGNKRLGIKSAKTRMNTFVNGESISKIAARKAHETMKNTILEDGTTVFDRRSERIATSLYVPNDDGITRSDIGKMRCLKMRVHEPSGIFYQGSYELHFLDSLYELNGADWIIKYVSRGPVFKYYDPIKNKTRSYLSDYIITYAEKPLIVEVKSRYWWFRFEHENHCKAKQVVSKNYDFNLYMKDRMLTYDEALSLRP